jgi:serine/threonine protein kinase
MGTLPELEAVKIMKHIMIGFKEQIRKRVIHRDLKPSNIFLKSNIPKIADYGFSKMMDEPKEKFYYNVGTPFYMCPQSLMQNKYSEKSDIWSLGVIFYELLYGTVPWNA